MVPKTILANKESTFVKFLYKLSTMLGNHLIRDNNLAANTKTD